jgi:hypothetical protein
MEADKRRLVTVWQDAEGAGRLDEADAAFRTVAAGWPRRAVPAGLARRVAALAPRPESLWASWWVRVPVGAAVGSVGVALGWQSAGTLASMGLASFQAVAAGVGTALDATGLWVSMVAAVASPLMLAASALGRALAEPGPVAVLVVGFGISVGALAALRRVLVVREV